MAKRTFENGLKKLDELAKHEHGLSLQELLADGDDDTREKRLWRLTGVLIKQRFSLPVRRRPARTTGAMYRWEIDPKRLRELAAKKSWETNLLASFKSRRRDESVVAYGVRLKSETRYGKEFKNVTCEWLCHDPVVVREIEQAFKSAKLGKLLHLSTSVGLVGGLALELASKIPALSMLEQSLVVAMTVIIATIGIIAFCRVAGYSVPKKKAAPRSISRRPLGVA
ncbi:hypothetical protein JQ615_32820 [Bradyrhizobium jicamae]|uniref:Uncharacterized protein n=1 Tax=Bradyrhizobium jicamae TaxID=280332 RepID=A0ABS5FTM3_9BRAD|nr:hypothetical protein [Bradyrhizobium jicamae]MBR0800162.1 hypothetical protein [Bradyrhizobium jicamae]MBR0936371.1 hypothetical protein [Bradyrhizobium jicamae]